MSIEVEGPDEYGHSIHIRGMVHRLAVWDPHFGRGVPGSEADPYVLFGQVQFAPNGFNLTQSEVDALYEFLGGYVSPGLTNKSE